VKFADTLSDIDREMAAVGGSGGAGEGEVNGEGGGWEAMLGEEGGMTNCATLREGVLAADDEEDIGMTGADTDGANEVAAGREGPEISDGVG